MRVAYRASLAGYSLIELLIAIVLMGILAALGYARVGTPVQHTRVQRAANMLASDLQFAQLLAVRQRRPIAVIVDPSTRAYIIRLRDTSLTFRNRFLGQDSDFQLDSLSVSPTTVTLYPNGVAAATATFTLGLRNYTRHVRFTRAGQVRITP